VETADKQLRRRLIIPLLSACFVCVLCPPVGAESPAIAMELACYASAGAVSLRVTLRNVGRTDTAVVLGKSIGNGNRYLPDSLALEVKVAGDNVERRFEYSDPSVPAVAGRIDPWIVTLPAASEYSLTRPLGHFWSNGQPLRFAGKPLDVRLQLNARATEHVLGEDLAGDALVHVLVGELRTEWLRIPTACAAGQPVAR
jgi:hypothetical protein